MFSIMSQSIRSQLGDHRDVMTLPTLLVVRSDVFCRYASKSLSCLTGSDHDGSIQAAASNPSNDN